MNEYGSFILGKFKQKNNVFVQKAYIAIIFIMNPT